MIRYVPHKNIDKAAWDAILMRCTNKLWYARSSVLDRTGPWDALMDDEAGALMPLTHRMKWGVSYLYNPYGLQQLGVFAVDPSRELADAFFASIPGHFRYVDIWSNEHSRTSDTVPGKHEPQTNQTLLCDKRLEELRAAYSKGHRRNLRKGGAPAMDHDLSVDDFLRLFERTTGTRFGGSPSGSLTVLSAILSDSVKEGTGRILCARREGRPVAAACYITWGGRSIFLKSANDAQGMAVNAMFHITDRWIGEHAGTGMLLDFAGSNTPSVARFNAGFGALPSTYFRFRMNRLPWPLNLLKR